MQHSKNYDKVKMYYDTGVWDKDKVRLMVTNPKSSPWITAAEYEEITDEKY